jgi:para-nitrobenzyl esterase
MSSFLPDEPAAVQARRTEEMWVRPARALAEAQVAAGGTVWLSRFDATPSLPPFPAFGPSHGADNACLWARPPHFLERPILQRPGGVMSPGDLAVTEALQAAVLDTVTDGTPGWTPYDADGRATALFDVDTRVRSDPSGERRRAWESVAAPV